MTFYLSLIRVKKIYAESLFKDTLGLLEAQKESTKADLKSLERPLGVVSKYKELLLNLVCPPYSFLLYKEKIDSLKHKINNIKTSGEYKLSHHIDLKSGYYNGKKILDI